jgi:hypothetical protein
LAWRMVREVEGVMEDMVPTHLDKFQ